MAFSADEAKNRARFHIWAAGEKNGHILKYEPGRLYPGASEEIETFLENLEPNNVLFLPGKLQNRREEITRSASLRTNALNCALRGIKETLTYRFDRYRVEKSGYSEKVSTTNLEAVNGHARLEMVVEDQVRLLKEAEKLFPASGIQMVAITAPHGQRYLVFNKALWDAIKTGKIQSEDIKKHLRPGMDSRVDLTFEPRVLAQP